MTQEELLQTVLILSQCCETLGKGRARPCRNIDGQLCTEGTVYDTPVKAREASDEMLETIKIINLKIRNNIV